MSPRVGLKKPVCHPNKASSASSSFDILTFLSYEFWTQDHIATVAFRLGLREPVASLTRPPSPPCPPSPLPSSSPVRYLHASFFPSTGSRINFAKTSRGIIYKLKPVWSPGWRSEGGTCFLYTPSDNFPPSVEVRRLSTVSPAITFTPLPYLLFTCSFLLKLQEFTRHF